MTVLNKLNKKDYDKLKELFDEYCNLFYKKQYPFTLNNVVNYCEQALLHYILIEDDYYIKSFIINRDKEIDFIWKTENYEDDSAKFITTTGIFCNEYVLEEYNKYLKNEFTRSV